MLVEEKDVMASTNYLHPDILRTIFLKLPAESLRRFKIVCKSWNDIISDYDFLIINYLQQSKNIFLWGTPLFPHRTNKAYGLVKFEKGNFLVEAIQRKSHPGNLVCSGHGLALLTVPSSSASYRLLNLSTKQQRIIPRPYRFGHGTAFGFCHGLTLRDYKIVAIHHKYYAVFSYINNAWLEKKQFPYNIHRCIRGGVSTNGFCFWAMKEVRRKTFDIFYFDPRDDTFNKLHKPRQITGDFFLTNLNGRLCLYAYEFDGTRGLRIWTIKDHITDGSKSWTELLTIRRHIVHVNLMSESIVPLYFTEKNELVYREGHSGTVLGIYNSVEEKFKRINAPITSIISSEIVPCS